MGAFGVVSAEKTTAISFARKDVGTRGYVSNLTSYKLFIRIRPERIKLGAGADRMGHDGN